MTNEHAEDIEASPPDTQSRIRAATDVAKAGLRTFAMTHFIVDFLIGGALAIACFSIAYDGVWWRGLLAAVGGLAAALVTGFILAAMG